MLPSHMRVYPKVSGLSHNKIKTFIHCEATQRVMVAKLTRLTQNSNTTAPSGRELYQLQFSLQVTSLETSGYTLVYAHNFHKKIKLRQIYPPTKFTINSMQHSA